MEFRKYSKEFVVFQSFLNNFLQYSVKFYKSIYIKPIKIVKILTNQQRIEVDVNKFCRMYYFYDCPIYCALYIITFYGTLYTLHRIISATHASLYF